MTKEEAIQRWIIPAIKNTWNEKKCQEIIKALEQEPCEDAISRQAVLEVVNNPLNVKLDKIIERLPSVQPKQKVWKKSKTDVLDKIRAEIEDAAKKFNMRPEISYDTAYSDGLYGALSIIDKYRAESEKV